MTGANVTKRHSHRDALKDGVIFPETAEGTNAKASPASITGADPALHTEAVSPEAATDKNFVDAGYNNNSVNELENKVSTASSGTHELLDFASRLEDHLAFSDSEFETKYATRAFDKTSDGHSSDGDTRSSGSSAHGSSSSDSSSSDSSSSDSSSSDTSSSESRSKGSDDSDSDGSDDSDSDHSDNTHNTDTETSSDANENNEFDVEAITAPGTGHEGDTGGFDVSDASDGADDENDTASSWNMSNDSQGGLEATGRFTQEGEFAGTCCVCSKAGAAKTILFAGEGFREGLDGNASTLSQCRTACSDICKDAGGGNIGCYGEHELVQLERLASIEYAPGDGEAFEFIRKHEFGNIC